MNDNRSLHDELAHEARQLPLTSTGIEVILETAGRRRRRRNVAAVGSVLAVTAVTVVGIQQLSRVDEPQLPTASSDTVVPVATTVPAAEVTPTTVYTGPSQSGMDLAAAVPAEASAPVMTWTVLDAAGPEALALRYGGADQRYALATEPSGSQPGQRGLYEQRDGAWVQLSDDVLPEGLRQAAVSGDSIYAVGTAPAVAGEAPGSVGRYDIANRSWDLLPLPEEARPYQSDAVRSSANMSIAPIDGGAIVLITRGSGYLDYRAVQSVLGAPENLADFRWVDGRLEVNTDCDYAVLEEAMTALDGRGITESEFLAAQHDAMGEACTVEYLTAADLGLSDADQMELDRAPATLMYRYDGETLAPVEPPAAAGTQAGLTGNVLTAYTPDGSHAWFVQPDGSFERIFSDLGSLDGTWIREFDGILATGANGVIVTGAPGAPPSLVDVSGAVVDDTMRNPTTWINSVASNELATVAAVAVDYQRIDAVTEPTTIEGSTYDLVVDPVNGVTIVERATGRTLADGYELATEPGALRLVARAGDDLVYGDTPPATTVPVTAPFVTSPPFDGASGEVIDEFTVDWQTLAPWSQAHTLKIVSSVDGRSYAVESFDDLIGLAPGEHASANSVDIVDGRFLIRGWVSEADGGPRSIILVGTPNT